MQGAAEEQERGRKAISDRTGRPTAQRQSLEETKEQTLSGRRSLRLFLQLKVSHDKENSRTKSRVTQLCPHSNTHWLLAEPAPAHRNWPLLLTGVSGGHSPQAPPHGS